MIPPPLMTPQFLLSKQLARKYGKHSIRANPRRRWEYVRAATTVACVVSRPDGRGGGAEQRIYQVVRSKYQEGGTGGRRRGQGRVGGGGGKGREEGGSRYMDKEGRRRGKRERREIEIE